MCVLLLLPHQRRRSTANTDKARKIKVIKTLKKDLPERKSGCIFADPKGVKFFKSFEIWVRENKIKNYFSKALRKQKEVVLLHPL